MGKILDIMSIHINRSVQVFLFFFKGPPLSLCAVGSNPPSIAPLPDQSTEQSNGRLNLHYCGRHSSGLYSAEGPTHVHAR